MRSSPHTFREINILSLLYQPKTKGILVYTFNSVTTDKMWEVEIDTKSRIMTIIYNWIYTNPNDREYKSYVIFSFGLVSALRPNLREIKFQYAFVAKCIVSWQTTLASAWNKYLFLLKKSLLLFSHAPVAEMADAEDLKSFDITIVLVQVQSGVLM